MLLKEKKIAIVGGGPGGLMLARLLQIEGFDVNVYERDLNRQVRVQGATLDLHFESGLKAMKKAGLMDSFKAAYRPGADRIRVTDDAGEIFLDQHGEDTSEDFDNPWFRPEIDRGPPRELLLDSLNMNTVIWDSFVTEAREIDNKWIMTFRNGNTAEADLLIAADGANSKIRPIITPARAFYTGITVVEGNIYDAVINAPRLNGLLRGGKVFALGDSKTIVLSSKGDGSIAFYLGFGTAAENYEDSLPKTKTRFEILNWFKEAFREWDPLWHELFDHPSTSYTIRPLFCMPLDQTWSSRANITMLGDAAHLMPPYAGEGVNMAMLDALELSEALTHQGLTNISERFSLYENQMLRRSAKVARLSLDNTEWMHSPKGLEKILQMFNPQK